MTRRAVQPRQVQSLAAECRDLLRWLQSPEGAALPPPTFARALRAYVALRRAIELLPRGPAELVKARAVKRVPVGRPQPVKRDADSFSKCEIALLDEEVLTAQGWIVPAPLLPLVDEVRAELRAAGKPDRDSDAAREILQRAAKSSGQRPLARDHQKLKTRISRARAAVTEREQRMPPHEGPA